MKQKMNPITEIKVKEIADFLFRRDYPKTAITSIFDVFGTDKTTAEALAVLTSGKLIRIDDSLGKQVSLVAVALLDQNGKDIRHEMIQCYFELDTFGNWFYDVNGKDDCWDHLPDFKPNECLKCFKYYASWICVSHNQSMPFCEKCRINTIKFKEVTTQEKSEEFINLCCKIHRENLILRKGLELEKPVYTTAIKEVKTA